jgi:CheY-like chemotaxis protein
MVQGDPGRLRQILLNLVGNAIKFTEQGEVVVRAEVSPIKNDDLQLTVSIKDTGIGIPQGKLESLFDSFTQVDASTTRKYGGSGLGLSICKQLCELMGGEISVKSELGKGSEFTFNLALKASLNNRKSMPKQSIDGINILVVDDNKTNQQVLSGQLTLWGAKVTTVSSAQEAIAQLDRAKSSNLPFKVAYLDMQMPDTDGVSLAKSIRKNTQYQDLKLIMMTSMGSRGDAQYFADIGFDAYFSKPATTGDLRDSLAVVLAGGELVEKAHPLVTKEYIHGLQKNKEQDELNLSDSRILLVEDNTVNQMVAKAMLAKMHASCDVAEHGEEAIHLLRQAPNDMPYQLILMDCQMPVMDGYSATEAIRQGRAGERYLNIPIIAMTANAMKGDQEKCIAAGMDDYISKPVSSTVLNDKMRDYLL